MPSSAPATPDLPTTAHPAVTTSATLESGRVSTRPFPTLAKSFLEVSHTVRGEGLLARTPWFYSFVATGLILGFIACGVGFALLRDSWFQLLIAAALGVLFTQVAFLAHESAHRTILSTGPANDRLSQVLGGVVGMSYSWWDSKHSRHHANPNKVEKDPDIAHNPAHELALFHFISIFTIELCLRLPVKKLKYSLEHIKPGNHAVFLADQIHLSSDRLLHHCVRAYILA